MTRSNIRENFMSYDIVSSLEARWDCHTPLVALVDEDLIRPDLGRIIDTRLLNFDPAQRRLVHIRA